MFSWHRESYLLYKCHYKPKVDWLANNDTHLHLDWFPFLFTSQYEICVNEGSTVPLNQEDGGIFVFCVSSW